MAYFRKYPRMSRGTEEGPITTAGFWTEDLIPGTLNTKHRCHALDCNIWSVLISTKKQRTNSTMTGRRSIVSNTDKLHHTVRICRDKLVPVNKAQRVLRLRMVKWPPIWKVAVNILSKQSGTADKGRPFSLGIGQGANNSSP